MRFLLLLLFFTGAFPVFSQTTVVRGFVRDSVDGQVISGASVRFDGQEKVFRTNVYGFFEINDPVGGQLLVVSHGHYVEKKIPVEIGRINALDVLLLPVQADSLLNEENYPALQLFKKMMGNRKIPDCSYRLLVFGSDLLTDGYLPTHRLKEKSKFNIGPIASFAGQNSIEGIRLALGGATTSRFDKRFYFKIFGAYGFRDERFKYTGAVAWSFNGKDPGREAKDVNSLFVRYRYDIRSLNEYFSPVDRQNIFLSCKRQQENSMIYQQRGSVGYIRKFGGGLGAEVWGFLQREVPAGDLQLISEDEQGRKMATGYYDVSGIGLKLYCTPYITATYQQGIKGLLSGDYSYRYAEVAAKKTFPATFGRVVLHASAGRIWGDVPFTLLAVPNYNLSFGILQGGYSMMNLLEFINDKYVSFDVEAHFNGLLFDKIPVVSGLHPKEVISFSGLYGGLSPGKLPENNRMLFVFPEFSGLMGKDPYLEVGIGLENIFKMFRVDYVRRLTYLNKPGISRGGLRFSLKLSLK
jgi:hypothetical protein